MDKILHTALRTFTESNAWPDSFNISDAVSDSDTFESGSDLAEAVVDNYFFESDSTCREIVMEQYAPGARVSDSEFDLTKNQLKERLTEAIVNAWGSENI